MTDIKDRPISEKRSKEVVDKLIQTVRIDSLVRRVLKVRSISTEEAKEEFLKFGISLIVDKAFFVDEEEGDETYYSYQGIGYEEGQSIAEGEAKELFKTLNQFEDKNRIDIGENFTYSLIDDGINKLKEHHLKCDFIISNIHDIFEFWHMSKSLFDGVIKSENVIRQTPRLEGYYKDIPVYWNRLLPRGKIILMDSTSLGDFIVKRDINAKITEINDSEKDTIMQALPELRNVNLKEKVRLYADEVVKIKITNKDAFIVLNFKSRD